MVIDGQEIYNNYIDNQVKKAFNFMDKKGVKYPSLSIIYVGKDKASDAYAKSIKKRLQGLKMGCNIIHFNEGCSYFAIIERIKALNENESVTGIMLLKPLPVNMNDRLISNTISPIKDIDCVTDVNIGRLYSENNIESDMLVPCTAKSIITIINRMWGKDLSGFNAVVVGRSNVVGKPVAHLLTQQNATVTLCHSHTIDLEDICQDADILITATGKPGLITGHYVSGDTLVVDAGIAYKDGKMVGDIDFDSVKYVAEYITPVPGGVGPVTNAALICNLLKCKLKQMYHA